MRPVAVVKRATGSSSPDPWAACGDSRAPISRQAPSRPTPHSSEAVKPTKGSTSRTAPDSADGPPQEPGQHARLDERAGDGNDDHARVELPPVGDQRQQRPA